MSNTETYDLVIVGGGPAALTAAIYSARRELNTLVIAKALGGQAVISNEIENYPGCDLISGFDLMNKFYQQAQKFGAKFVFNEVNQLEKDGDHWLIKTNSETYTARAVMLAFGLTPRDLGVPGEEKFKGRGVTYCATCDGPFYKNKTVAVVGGGNSGVEAAEYLSKLARQVYLINNTDQPTAEGQLLEQIKNASNIEIKNLSQIKEIQGDKKVEKIIVTKAGGESEIEELPVDGVFIEIGYQAKTGWLKGTIDLNERGEITINRYGETSAAGVFAAGDCADSHYKQIVVAAGEGAKAALQAYKYISAQTGQALRPDWGKK